MTTHELAKMLLSQQNTIFKFGHFVSNCGDSWWEEIEHFEYTVGEEGFILREDYNGEEMND
jgi:hypothetical protein